MGFALFEFVDGSDHLLLVDVVHFESFADGAQQGDGEFAAEVFAEFFQAGEDN